MAAGECVSVSSQSDTEEADLALERKSLSENIEFERDELAKIYEARGLTSHLASQVAEQLMLHDALGAHARDEIGIIEHSKARPIQAAFSSAATFTAGALLPLLVAWLVPPSLLIALVALLSLVFLAALGGLAARAGGVPVLRASVRVTFWGPWPWQSRPQLAVCLGLSLESGKTALKTESILACL